MKFFLILSVPFFLGSSLLAQRKLADIKLNYPQVEEIQGVAVNDSIFLTMKNGFDFSSKYVSMWVLPNGEVKDADVAQLSGKTVFAVQNSGDSIFFYYFEAERKEVTIKALAQSKTTGKNRFSGKRILLKGKLLGAYLDRNLFLITSSKKDYSLVITEVNNMTVENEEIFKLSAALLRQGKSNIAFIAEDAETRQSQAEAPVKIYKQNKSIFIGVDEPYNQDAPNTPKSTIIKLDLEKGTSEIKSFFELTQQPFRTFVSGNYIFKVVANRGFDISIFDFNTTKIVKSLRVDKTSTIRDSIYFFRDGNLNLIEKRKSVWAAMDNRGDCFITASPIDSAFILKIGTHRMVKPVTYVPVVSVFGPLVQLALLATQISVLSATDAQSIDHYYYMKWDGKESLTYISKPENISQIIDKYELEKIDFKFQYKGYISSKKLTYGIYKAEDSGLVNIVKFTKP